MSSMDIISTSWVRLIEAAHPFTVYRDYSSTLKTFIRHFFAGMKAILSAKKLFDKINNRDP